MRKNIKVKIPAGVNNGSTLRVRGEGDAGPRGYDLLLTPFWSDKEPFAITVTSSYNGGEVLIPPII